MNDEHVTTILGEWEFATRTMERLESKRAALKATVTDAVLVAGSSPTPELRRVAGLMGIPVPDAHGPEAS
jgi:hypothetical protein